MLKNNDELFKNISMDIDFDKLPSEQQQEILSFIEFVKKKENDTKKTK